jgi:hypothetical protein
MTFRLFLEARRRLLPHAIFFFAVWPALSILFAAIRLRGHPISDGVPFRALLSGMAAGALYMLPEFGAAAILGFFLSTLLFALIAASEGSIPSRAVRRGAVGAEPLLLFAAVFLGVCLEYPALVYHPALFILRSLRVYQTVLVLAASLVAFAMALGWRQGGPRRAVIFVAVAVAVTALTWAASRNPESAGSAGSRETVLLGIDSVSQVEDVSALRNATRRLGGIWYEKPVPPGLLTNSVWPSILMNRRPSETGIFFVFQKPNWARAPFNLILRARREGCRTFAYLETGFSAYIGREPGFDEDGSGPRGWLQPATAAVKSASVLLSVLLPRLPAIPGALTPANQTGTFAYDLRREVHQALTAGAAARCSLTASHLDYLHQTAFPASSQLTPAERRAVWGGRTRGVRDLDLDWQDPAVPDEPLDVSAWKLAYIQRVILEELGETRFLDPPRKNRLILFSDHGIRRDISESNFGEARYHRVLFATFGVPPRGAALPISLLDIPAMLGLGDPRRPGPSEPVVEYANATPREWSQMMDSARLESDGSILLNRKIVEQIGQRMTGYRPYSGSTDYCPAPSTARAGTSR